MVLFQYQTMMMSQITNDSGRNRRENSSRQSVEAGLKNLPEHSLRNLAIRERNRMAGTHVTEVNSLGTSREITLDHISRLAYARLLVAATYPKISRTSSLFNEATAYVLMSPEQKDAYERAHPEKF